MIQGGQHFGLDHAGHIFVGWHDKVKTGVAGTEFSKQLIIIGK